MEFRLKSVFQTKIRISDENPYFILKYGIQTKIRISD
jgi:hypothetical protein